MVLSTSGRLALWGWTPKTTDRTEGLPLGSSDISERGISPQGEPYWNSGASWEGLGHENNGQEAKRQRDQGQSGCLYLEGSKT